MKFNIPPLKLPTKEEMIEAATKWQEPLLPHYFTNWSDELVNMSIPTGYVTLPDEHIENIFNGKEDAINACAKVIDDFVTKHKDFLAHGFFVKLQSRSPKDSVAVNQYGQPLPLHSGKEALDAIASSMRCLDDMILLRHLGDIKVAIRPFKKWEAYEEWRCYVKDRKIVGISQYFYDKKFHQLEDINYVCRIKDIIQGITQKVISEMTVDDFIVDYVVTDTDTIMLETNPWGKSDPCLFYAYSEFKDPKEYEPTIRTRSQNGKIRIN